LQGGVPAWAVAGEGGLVLGLLIGHLKYKYICILYRKKGYWSKL